MEKVNNFITVVTGLPRSGTTLLMRMLEAGGIPPYYDNSKPVSWTEDGVDYLNHNVILRETDKIKDLVAGDSSWLKDCYGMAVKVLAPDKVILPKGHKYKFIWCDRKIKHMVKSQQKEARNAKRSCPPEDVLTDNVRKARIKGRALLKSYPGCEFMEVKFESLLKKPDVTTCRLENFFFSSSGVRLDKERMASVVVKRPASCMSFMMEERIYLDKESKQHTFGYAQKKGFI